MKKKGLAVISCILIIATTTSTVIARTDDVKQVEVKDKETVNVEDSLLVRFMDEPIMSTNPVILTNQVKTERKLAIDESVFSTNSVRLNTEIYDIASKVINSEHSSKCFSYSDTNLAMSYKEHVNPLIPLALSVCETGMWMDTKYTWSSAVYSNLFESAGVNMQSLSVDKVNTDTYIANGLTYCLGCGPNCTANQSSHYHGAGANDNDSLGPLQILRRYVESSKGYIVFDCGEQCADLMDWKDNVQYVYHIQGNAFCSLNNWNREYEIKNSYQLMVLMAIAHNTGTAYLNTSGGDCAAGSAWKSADSVYKFSEAMTNTFAMVGLKQYINDWYETVKTAEGGEFILPGQWTTAELDKVLHTIGLGKSAYSYGFQHKQYYPVKALLNYMALEKLYFAGE